MIPAKRYILLACVAGCSCGAQTTSPLPLSASSSGSTANYHLNVLTRPTLDDKIVVLRLAPNIATSVWLPEPTNSVVVGFPECFAEEHSEGESRLVTLRPKRNKEACESNVQITTVSGKHALLAITSLGAATPANQTVDVLLQYATQAPGNFLEERSAPSLFVAETRPLEAELAKGSSAKGGPVATPALLTIAVESNHVASPLDTLLARQQQAPLPTLYGQKTGRDCTRQASARRCQRRDR